MIIEYILTVFSSFYWFPFLLDPDQGRTIRPHCVWRGVNGTSEAQLTNWFAFHSYPDLVRTIGPHYPFEVMREN